MNHDEAIDWLFSLHRFGMKLGLDNTRVLLDALGRPQDRFDSVLVAGTNGKGSTAAMIHATLVAAGIRSGLYTSPHLVHTEERIRIDDADIPPEDLVLLLSDVRSCIDRLCEKNSGPETGHAETSRAGTVSPETGSAAAGSAGTGCAETVSAGTNSAGADSGAAAGNGSSLAAYPTFFEVLTAAGLLAFGRARVEIAVLEVGLGGRLDATNIVTPLLSVITSIDLDHQEQLGSTLASIAREKAGILRRGVPGLLGEIGDEALQAIRDEASAIGAPLILASEGCRLVDVRGSSQMFALTTPVRSYPSLSCPLPGAHQRSNARLAVRAAETLDERLFASLQPSPRGRIDADAIVRGIAAVRWPGRLEWVDASPRLLLDGAHNAAGCRVLARYLTTLPVRPVLLFAAMRDKEVGTMLEALLPGVSAAVFTMPPMGRACDPFELLRTAREVRTRVASRPESRSQKAGPRSGGRARPVSLKRARAAVVMQGLDEIAMLRATSPPSLEIEPLHNPAEVLPWTESEGWHADADVDSALALARRLAGPGGTVLVAGSLFLVGAVKEVLAGLPVRAGALS